MSITVGVDMGHCNDAVTVIIWENGANHARQLYLTANSDYIINTEITLTNQQMEALSGKAVTKALLDTIGPFGIGDRAVREPEDGEYFVYFKRPPEKFDSPCGNTETAKRTGLTYGRLMAIFLYQLVKNMRMYNSHIDLSEIVLQVGCPSTDKWTSEKNRRAYGQLIAKATGVPQVEVIPESRAAMFSSVERGKQAFSAADGVLVFDFGSSTTDCTYMLQGKKIIEFSWDLGASAIEQQMMMRAYRECREKNRESSIQCIHGRTSENLRILRKAKEEYYNGNGQKVYPVFIDRQGNEYDQRLVVNREVMESIVEAEPIECECDSKTIQTGSWKTLCRKFYEEAHRRLKDENLPCKAIILTGGASQMEFIRNLCKEVFQDFVAKGMKVYQDQNPALSVSTGLGWVGVADENYEKCLEEAKREMRNSQSGDFSKLKKLISNNLYPVITKVVNEVTERWAGSTVDSSAKDLQNQIEGKMKSVPVRTEIDREVQKAIDVWKDGFKSDIQKAVNHQAEKLFSREVAQGVILSDKVWANLEASQLAVNVDVGSMVQQLNLGSTLNKVISNAVALAVAIAVIIALAPFIPFFNIPAGGIAYLFASSMISDEDMEKKRDQKMRKKIQDEMKKALKKDNTIEKITSDVEKALEECEKQANGIMEETLRQALDIMALRRFDKE